MYKQIYVTMLDEFEEKEVTRVIDLSNFTTRYGCIPEKKWQRLALLEWIRDRAEAQHETLLTLISWEIK